uniref:NADH-ubiquinone oxidoreductase chain 3 n=1 Tax=Polyacanthorhynchus caballeroi TaxID=178082 RepID=A0A140DJ75_9BILA|nr:NADH dehydrogenase subunit 3 [Polyacanthorhynchus caballeroi]AMK47829.1 NADH dehydrogenase subunit 3 [Polyacanthorhynchus caballeroi]
MVYVVLILSAVFVGGGVVLMVRGGGLSGLSGIYECGLEQLVVKGSYFSLRFFLLSLLFLLMDLEVGLLVMAPFVVGWSCGGVIKFMVVLWLFLLALLYEWWAGGVDWSL